MTPAELGARMDAMAFDLAGLQVLAEQRVKRFNLERAVREQAITDALELVQDLLLMPAPPAPTIWREVRARALRITTVIAYGPLQQGKPGP